MAVKETIDYSVKCCGILELYWPIQVSLTIKHEFLKNNFMTFV